jgi:hypothetical protein
MYFMKKTFLVLLVVVSVLAVSTVIATLRVQGQKASLSKKEVATPVQDGVISEKQKQHRQLYKEYKGVGKLQELSNREAKNGDDGLTVALISGPPELSPQGQSAAPVKVLDKLAAEADAVVVGVVTGKASQLTENGSFIFTDYDMTVEEVLKDNRAAHVEPQTSLSVTRPGGKVALNGREVTAIDRSFKRLAIGGRYLLFLRYIPATGAYQPLNDKGSFEIDDNKVAALAEMPDAAFRDEQDASAFINEIRMAISAGERGNTKGNK